jgi:hypothetical protein
MKPLRVWVSRDDAMRVTEGGGFPMLWSERPKDIEGQWLNGSLVDLDFIGWGQCKQFEIREVKSKKRRA